MSMRSRITAAFAMCISLPMVAGMGALWLGTEDTLRQQAFDDLRVQTRNVVTDIEQQMAQNLAHLKAWSALPIMQELLIGDEGGELTRALSDLNMSYSDFASLTITNAQGAVISTTDPALRKDNLSSLDAIHAAVSGRATQSNFTKLRVGGLETIQFTVPLVASYDRQTVIGTLTGVIDFQTIAKRAINGSPLNQERRIFALTQKDTSKIVYANRSTDGLVDTLARISTDRNSFAQELSRSGETHLAAFAKSGGKILGKDPGLVAFGIEPASSVFAAADKVTNIFIAVAGLAALPALLIAWHWSTPLVQLTSNINRLARGDQRTSIPEIPAHSTFAPLAKAFELVKEIRLNRDLLAARELELTEAHQSALTLYRAKERQLQEMGNALKSHMTEIVELCDMINRENLSAAAARRPTQQGQELNRSAVHLLAVVQSVVAVSEASAHEIKNTPSAGDTPALQRLSA